MSAPNAKLNGEWARHVRRPIKRQTAKLRRAQGKRRAREGLRRWQED